MRKQFDRKPKSNFGGRSFDSRPKHSEGKSAGRFKAICGKCGASCDVPFKPSAVRPVLCKNCFKRDDVLDFRPNSRAEGGKRFDSDRSIAPSANTDQLQRQIAIINAKLDKILDILEDFEADDDD